MYKLEADLVELPNENWPVVDVVVAGTVDVLASPKLFEPNENFDVGGPKSMPPLPNLIWPLVETDVLETDTESGSLAC